MSIEQEQFFMNVNHTLPSIGDDNICIDNSHNRDSTRECMESNPSQLDDENEVSNHTAKGGQSETTECDVIKSDHNEADKHVESDELSEGIQHICRSVELSSDRNKTSYYQRNKGRILEYARERYKNNRDRLLAYSKSYQGQRKDEVSLRNAEYYYNNKESLLLKRSESLTCTCGRTITKGALSNHLKTKYHAKHTSIQECKNQNQNQNEIK